jgi:hypothetical protein
MRNTNTAGDASWWSNYATTGFRYVVGDKYNIYFEDNVFNLGITGVPNYNIVTDSQYSGRYAFRFNTINMTWDAYPLFDLHGNQDVSHGNAWSCFGGEIYENTINANGYALDLIDHRGGQMLVYNNTLINANDSYIQIRDEYADSANPTISLDPQYPNRTYYWNNTDGVGGPVIRVTDDNLHILGHPLVNNDYFTNDTTNGVAGLSTGPIFSRPASALFEGYGYWATDEKKLYRWHSGAWQLFYTPFTYPHPLRSDPIIGD